MIVRTYTRRSRSSSDVAALDSDDDSPVDASLPLSFYSEDPYALSSQESYGLGDLHLVSSSSQEDGARGCGGRRAVEEAATATLMETQECGEMMEHMDEVNFALDGLRPGHAVRVRRASLLSLLTICAGAHQRRLLRAQGTMKKIIDAVLDLNFDDPPCTIASAAFFYVLASDVQDDLLQESPACVHFLIKLLNPPTSDAVKDKAPSIGSRLMLIRPPEIKNGINKRLDSGATSIILKVQEILLHCKEIKPSEGDEGVERPELTSKWIGLLTMEKACLSTVSFEDISGPMRNAGGDFKEKLRELGGLDAVVNIAVTCYSNMEGCLEGGASPQELKDVLASDSVILFLKCLKILENATFLSKENQNHLLEMSIKLDKESSLSCVELIIRAIKFFSGLSLRQRSFSSSYNARLSHRSASITANFIPEIQLKEGCQENHSRILSSSSAGCPGAPRSPPSMNFEAPSKRQRLSQTKQGYAMQISEITIISGSFEKSTDSNAPVSCKRAANGLLRGFSVNTNESKVKFAKGSNQWISINAIGSKMGSGPKMNSVCPKRSSTESKECSATSPDGHFDPFAFDEDELGPSKWEALTKKKETNQTHLSTSTHQTTSIDKQLEDQTFQSTDIDKAVGDGFDNKCVVSCNELMNEKDNHSNEESDAGPSTVDGDSSLMEDCLLSAVKVLMNLTNDNLVGCQQIGSYGGLDTMASLIINHFPAFDSTSSHLQEDSLLKRHGNISHPIDKHLSDHELNFLVAILGLLVNLVEKDGNNRSRLVCARIPAAQIGILESHETPRDVIPLLCSIFLVNQGPEQVADGEISPSCNDEAALLQGEREAEMMIIEAYAALLLAFLSTESKKARESIADYLPSGNLKILVPVLERFVEFHLSLNMISPETHTAVCEVIESCRIS